MSMRHQHGVVAVIIKQYGTGLYRTCVSLSRENSVCLGTHTDEESASARLSSFWQAYDEGTIRVSEDLQPLIDPPESKTEAESGSPRGDQLSPHSERSSQTCNQPSQPAVNTGSSTVRIRQTRRSYR